MAVPSPGKEKPDQFAPATSPPGRSPAASPLRQEADSASETSTHSSETPERRDVDILTQVLSTRSEEYRLLFRLPADEVLVQDFNCALQENILLQGHMYIFVGHICFYSNIFGFETKRMISYHEITSVQKAKTAAIFSNAIEIFTGERKHFFGSFLSRDEAYQLIMDGWAQHNSDSRRYLDQQESRSDSSCQDNAAAIVERDNDYSLHPNCSKITDSIAMKNADIHENGELNGPLTPVEALSWKPEDVDAPKVPDKFTMVAEAKFPVQVEDFFKLFFSDAAASFLEKFHQLCGDKDLQCSTWRRHAESIHARELSFEHPIKIYFGAKFGHCRGIQKFRIYRNQHLVIETSQQVSNVPYGDYFHVQGLWDVENIDGETACILRVYLNVAFQRKTMWKGKIEQSTKEECREVYGIWINIANELLKQNNLEEEGFSVNIAQARDVGLESMPKAEKSETIPIAMSHATIPKMPPPQNIISLQEIFKFSKSIMSFFKELWTGFSSYLKTELHAPPVWIVLIAILILIQLSIIMVLNRTPKVHVVSHGNYMNGLDGRSEAIDWLEKRMYHLSEEMLIMETRLERMQQEFSWLKSHLQDFYRVKAKS